MDKRTLLFVISLSLTLLLVNMFFERQNQESLREHLDKQKALKIEQLAKLKVEIKDRTAHPENFPIAPFFLDSSEENYLSSGVKINDSVLSVVFSDEIPSFVYAEGKQYHLAYAPPNGEGPVLYELNPDDVLQIGDLPLIGHFELQLITPSKKKETPPMITLGEYVDGTFSIPLLKLIELHKDLEDFEGAKQYLTPGDSIVMMKVENSYYPVGTYQAASDTFIQLEQIQELHTELLKPQIPEAERIAKEQYFVLEDDFQQLVFSNRGGALVEINLPFTSDSKESVVKEIEFDREIAADHPYNAQFPLHSYFTAGPNPQGPFTENAKGKLGGYYPLIRRDLLRKGHRKSINVLPEYYALNVISQYPEMAEMIYDVVHFDDQQIVFEAARANRKITKTFKLNSDNKNPPYCFDLQITVEGDSRGLWITSGVPEVEMISGSPAPALKYHITRKGQGEVLKIDIPKESKAKDPVTMIYPDWIGNSNGFFGVIVDPLTEIDPGYNVQYVPGTTVPSRLIQIDEEYDRFEAKNLPGYMTLLPLNTKGGTMHFRVFAGPLASKTLKTVDSIYSNPETGYSPDYIASQTAHGWFTFISGPFSKFLFVLMRFFHYLTGSWAFSIILLTVALRLMLYPLNAWSTKSMLKMQEIGPEVQKIQEKHKKDPKKAQLEIMNLYRDKGVNPVSGCFPLLIQMPFLIGMFDLLKSTFELRGATFIPGWIDNLAAPDVLFSWSKPIFFVGTEFHLLPFLLGGVMFLQQRLMSTAPKDPNQMTEQQRQQRTMGTMMTLVFTVMFYHFPSGLNIYWLSSMLLGILQQWWTQKQLKLKAKEPVLITEPARHGRKGKKRR